MRVRKIGAVLLSCMLFCFSLVLGAQNPRAEGYMGLWSRSISLDDESYRYSGGLGTFSSQHTPLAIYSEEANKTYFVYSGTRSPEESHLQIMISFFDHKTNRVPRPVIIYDKLGVNDPQDNATISIDSGGFIYVFVSGRGRTRPGFIFKSRKPWSIDSFEQIFRGEIVFPQPWWLNDSCFMLMHTKVQRGREIHWSTGTDGKKWSTSTKLAGMGGHHQVTNICGNTLYSVFSYLPDGNPDKRTNLYLVRTDDFGKTWKSMDDKVLEIPLTEAGSDALIRDFKSEGKLVYIKDLNFDRSGNPVILALISNDYHPGVSGDPREMVIVKWNGYNWEFIRVSDTHHNYDMGYIYTDDDEWRIICTMEPGPQREGMGGELVLWTSTDEGESWEKTRVITSDSRFNNSYVRRPVNANREFYSFWVDGDPENLSESRIYFTDHECDKVWVLPYNMKKKTAKPERIR
jgi:hypothetical protein